jgi:hypothetical protein
VLSQAVLLYRRHFFALVLTCALALVPANVLATGALVFGLSSLGAGGLVEASTHREQVQQKQRDLQEKPPQTPEARDLRARQLGREALEGGAASDVRQLLHRLLPIAYATAVLAAVLLAGLFLAHAAVTPLVLDLTQGKAAGPAHCWNVVAPRIGAVLATGLLAAMLVALGALFFVIPGLVLAAGFSLAPPIVMLEGLSGHAALERSWRLLRGHFREAFLFWTLIVVFSLLASGAAELLPPGHWRPLASAVARMILYPLPLVGLVLLYRKCVSTSGGSQRPDSSGRGSRGSSPL